MKGEGHRKSSRQSQMQSPLTVGQHLYRISRTVCQKVPGCNGTHASRKGGVADRARACGVGSHRHRAGPYTRNFLRGCAGARFLVSRVVGERYSNPDGLSQVVGDQRVGGTRGSVDVSVAGQPLVAERGIGQSVSVRDA